MSIKLQPINRSTKQKVKLLQEKQNNWVLDCVNEQKTKLQPYSVVKDRFLKYFVVRVPKKQRNYSKTQRLKQSPCVDSIQFRDFLTSQKQKLLENRVEIERIGLTERDRNEQNGLCGINMKSGDKVKNRLGQQRKMSQNQQNLEEKQVKNKECTYKREQ